MRQTVKKILFAAGVALTLLHPSTVAAVFEGNCFNCHVQTEGVPGGLLFSDCVGCHAQGGDTRIVTLPGGIQIPQVYHYDPAGDLAGGNFVYIAESIGVGPTGSRKGHDVVDLFPSVYTFPPGFKHADQPTYFNQLTCAGLNGCHGIRNQLIVGPGGTRLPRVGIAALSGAHHANQDGQLVVADTVANSFRFLMGLQGLEHTYAPDRWRNVSPVIHNEYYGSRALNDDDYDLCQTCHVGSTEATLDSYITTPRHSVSGFCATCHSRFHAESIGALAFIRHPSDFVIPNKGEYAEYTTYEITAPVARPTVYDRPSDVVTPGRDMVMCLTCHVAHASPYDGMLRFDYTKMVAGRAGSYSGKGCFACHTSKGRRR